MTAFANLSTANLADACLRLGILPRCMPLRPVIPGLCIAGPAVVVRHFGSVDVFLEALNVAPADSVLVIDNGGRLDEACIGDLVGIEAQTAGIVGIVLWGCHRDTRELQEMRLPIFSLGSIATGPTRLDERTDLTFGSARIGEHTVHNTDYVVADDDGVLFFANDRCQELVEAASEIRRVEAMQAEKVRGSVPLREQLRFAEYLERRGVDRTYTFRDHLKGLHAAIEEGFH